MPPSRRQELVDAAERVFRREGFVAPSVDRVIQEAGVSRMTLYNHFKGKDDLIVAAIRRSSERALETLDACLDQAHQSGGDPALALFDFLELVVADPEFRGCLFQRATDEIGDASCIARDEVVTHRQRVLDRVRGALGDRSDAEERADDLVTVYDGALIHALVERACGRTPEGPSPIVARARSIARTILAASPNINAV